MSDVPSTVRRVPQHTAPEVDARLWRQTVDDVDLHMRGSGEQIGRRLTRLEREWTTERVLEANASSLVLLGSLTAALTRRRRWLFVPIVVGWFLLQHAVQGWCPPLAVIRRLGIRTEHEVDAERAALLRVQAHPGAMDSAETLLRQSGWPT